MWWKSWRNQAPSAGALEGAIRRALYDDARLRDFEAGRIGVRVSQQEVRLTGVVSNADARRIAEQQARRVRGIEGVRNDLRTDADLTRQLRDRLATDARTASLAKDALVFHGVAELRGSATYDGHLAVAHYRARTRRRT